MSTVTLVSTTYPTVALHSGMSGDDATHDALAGQHMTRLMPARSSSSRSRDVPRGSRTVSVVKCHHMSHHFIIHGLDSQC